MRAKHPGLDIRETDEQQEIFAEASLTLGMSEELARILDDQDSSGPVNEPEEFDDDMKAMLDASLAADEAADLADLRHLQDLREALVEIWKDRYHSEYMGDERAFRQAAAQYEEFLFPLDMHALESQTDWESMARYFMKLRQQDESDGPRTPEELAEYWERLSERTTRELILLLRDDYEEEEEVEWKEEDWED